MQSKRAEESLYFVLSIRDNMSDGVLSSIGSAGGGYGGGSTCFSAVSVVITRGTIECKAIGRDTVQCRQFMNEGVRPLGPEMLITVFLRGTAFGMVDRGIAITTPCFCSLCLW